MLNKNKKVDVDRSVYERLGSEIGELVATKQVAYGDSFGKSGELLKVLYPNGVKPEDYTDLLTITRIIDKLFRIANDKGAFEEDPFKDIAGYSLLSVGRNLKESTDDDTGTEPNDRSRSR
jgi:hypothetical protein